MGVILGQEGVDFDLKRVKNGVLRVCFYAPRGDVATYVMWYIYVSKNMVSTGYMCTWDKE